MMNCELRLIYKNRISYCWLVKAKNRSLINPIGVEILFASFGKKIGTKSGTTVNSSTELAFQKKN